MEDVCGKGPNDPAALVLWHCRRPAGLDDREESGKEDTMGDRRQMMKHYLDALAKRAGYGQYFEDYLKVLS